MLTKYCIEYHIRFRAQHCDLVAEEIEYLQHSAKIIIIIIIIKKAHT